MLDKLLRMARPADAPSKILVFFQDAEAFSFPSHPFSTLKRARLSRFESCLRNRACESPARADNRAKAHPPTPSHRDEPQSERNFESRSAHRRWAERVVQGRSSACRVDALLHLIT